MSLVILYNTDQEVGIILNIRKVLALLPKEFKGRITNAYKSLTGSIL